MPKFSLSPDVDKNKTFLLDRGELEGRFDAFYYLDKNKTRMKTTKLKPYIKDVFQGQTQGDNIVKIIKVLKVKNITNDGDFNFINVSYTDLVQERKKLKFGDIITPFRGQTILTNKFAYFEDETETCTIDNNLGVIRLDSSKIKPKFFKYYISSDIGFAQIKKNLVGAGIPAITKSMIYSLDVPDLKLNMQQMIIDIMDTAYKSKKNNEEKAKELLDSIDNYLLSELGITLPHYPSSNLDERVFEIDFSVVFGTRLDCLSHKPFYEDAINAIKKSSKNYSYELLRDLITHSISGDWGDDEKNITNFDDYTQCLVLRSTEIDNNYGLNIDGERKKYRYLKNTKLDRLNTRVNDILIEKSGGSPDQPVGRVALLTQEIFENDAIAFSNFIHKIRLNEKIQAEFAFNCLRTFYNRKITENMQSQTNGIRNLIMNEFLHIPMPLPKLEIQEQISKEIKLRRDEAKKLQNEAKELLDQAKKEVEKIILGEIK